LIVRLARTDCIRDAYRYKWNPAVSNPDERSLERDLVWLELSSGQCGRNTERWQVTFAATNERRDSPRDPVVIEGEKIVPERK
jgi:hypothetical protein